MTNKWINIRWFIIIMEYNKMIKKECTTNICNNRDESGNKYTKWDNLEKKGAHCMICSIYNF